MDNDREKMIEAARKAKTIEEVFDALGCGRVGSEAYYVEIVWEAIRAQPPENEAEGWEAEDQDQGDVLGLYDEREQP